MKRPLIASSNDNAGTVYIDEHRYSNGDGNYSFAECDDDYNYRTLAVPRNASHKAMSPYRSASTHATLRGVSCSYARDHLRNEAGIDQRLINS
ncbi:hypothetical protein LTR91_000958 [Friedmanniomyces endolithicus]|uniref:Uncharacterized protein n=1 Tax=Friedmanniomyces endolithicus TaxID=329885 RepID=A0AAN6R2D2_9PEZI|nr:hypothetical protein LTR94_007186 [Friedmanniomyces endolithicus]KAK0790009.1 hypothetical protein LTR38_010741 [Friedmanniomyces endolithicus]KAK0794415.1 hypothetical protein LTR59_007834 [Friedmanniomyces endolithicus]KAK0807269.1 hypothetical protein LTR75_006653 [Friedmanniomyces endolithicus]KAK0845594.1 hypothetical protein LTR03_007342 [Friedmanniomyces endolithicus]